MRQIVSQFEYLYLLYFKAELEISHNLLFYTLAGINDVWFIDEEFDSDTSKAPLAQYKPRQ